MAIFIFTFGDFFGGNGDSIFLLDNSNGIFLFKKFVFEKLRKFTFYGILQKYACNFQYFFKIVFITKLYIGIPVVDS